MNYVSAEWSGGGYAHVVENEEEFNEDFCLDILSGYLKEVPYHMRRRRSSSAADNTKNLGNFKLKWDMYDWVGYAIEL